MTLVTPRRTNSDPVMALISTATGAGGTPREISPGAMIGCGWSPQYGWAVDNGYDLSTMDRLDEIGVESPVVCDSPDQYLDRYGALLNRDEFSWCVFFVHIAKDKSNAGRGGGWRWLKWGRYIGDGSPEREYLDDEPGFDGGVYTAAVHRVTASVSRGAL